MLCVCFERVFLAGSERLFPTSIFSLLITGICVKKKKIIQCKHDCSKSSYNSISCDMFEMNFNLVQVYLNVGPANTCLHLLCKDTST